MIGIADWRVTPKQKRLVNQVLDSGRLTYGPMTDQFEKEFARIHGRRYGLFINSGTDALRIALHALKTREGWEDGDEVIIPAITFIATFNVVVQCNLKPVLVDVEKDFNINPNLIENAVTKKTRAIIPVNLLGLESQMSEIMAIAISHGLKVIEDSCEMVLSSGLGDVTCFSTYVAHHVITGVGGMILTDNKYLAKYMRSMMFHGRDDSYMSMDDNSPEVAAKRFIFDKPGYSARATELQAALGLGDLDNLHGNLLKRTTNARKLCEGLKVEFDPFHTYQFFPIMAKDRDDLMIHLEGRGIHTRPIMPLTTQPIVRKTIRVGIFPVAEQINREGLLIPCHPYLGDNDINYILESVKEFYG